MWIQTVAMTHNMEQRKYLWEGVNRMGKIQKNEASFETVHKDGERFTSVLLLY